MDRWHDHPSKTVLWGAHRGDTTYGSRDYWRRNIPLFAPTITMAHASYFDVGDVVKLSASDTLMRVVGMEGVVLGVHECIVPRPA